MGTFGVLCPPRNFFEQEKASAWRRESNNSSLVTKIRFGEVAFLFLGATEAEAERELVRLQRDDLDCTL